jgi:general secretion pathway protein G
MNRRRTVRKAFSLLELTLVVAIMGALMAVVAVNVFGKSTQAKRSTTEIGLRNLKNLVEEYNVTHNAFPPTLQTLVDVKIATKSNLRDGWGKDYLYSPSTRVENRPFALVSAGEDQLPNTADDINAWDVVEK